MEPFAAAPPLYTPSLGRPMRLTRRTATHFEQFAAEHGPGLVKLAYVVGGDRDQSQDAVQEALIRVYQRWSRLEDPLAYARRTVINATRDDWRRSRRREARFKRLVTEQRTDAAGPDPHDRLPAHDALMTALRSLPHDQRAVIVLRYGMQLSEAETAATLDVPTGTVKSRANRALAQLRRTLGDESAAALTGGLA